MNNTEKKAMEAAFSKAFDVGCKIKTSTGYLGGATDDKTRAMYESIWQSAKEHYQSATANNGGAMREALGNLLKMIDEIEMNRSMKLRVTDNPEFNSVLVARNIAKMELSEALSAPTANNGKLRDALGDKCVKCGEPPLMRTVNGHCLDKNNHIWQTAEFQIRDERCEAALDAHLLGMTAGEIWAYRQGRNESHALSSTPTAEGKWIAMHLGGQMPKDENAEYWWTRRTNGQVVKNGYNAKNRALYIDTYSAWMPIEKPEPYTPHGQEASE